MINKLIAYITHYMGCYLTDILCAFIILMAVYWFLRYDLSKLAVIVKNLRKINKRLSQIEKIYKDKFARVSRLLDGKVNSVLSRAWYNYCNDLEKSIETGRNPDCRLYFNTESIITVPACRAKAGAKPAVLGFIGILGVLLIFAAAFSNINSTAPTGEITSLLLSALKDGLGVLITAITAAIIYKVLDNMIYYKAERELLNLQTLLAQKILEQDSYSYLEIMTENMDQQTEYLRDMGEIIGTQIGSIINERIIPELYLTLQDSVKNIIEPFVRNTNQLVNKMSEFVLQDNSELIKNMSEHFINQLNTTADGQLEKFGYALRNLCDSQTKSKEELDTLIKELIKNISFEKEINESSQSVVETIAIYNRQIVDGNKELAESMEKIRILAEALNNLTGMAGEAINKFSEHKVNLLSENKEFFENVNVQTVKMQEAFKGETEVVLSRFMDSTSLMLKNMEGSMNGALERLTGSTEKMFGHMETLVSGVGMSAGQLTEKIEELNESLDDSVKEFKDQMHTGVEKTFEDFDHGLGQLCIRLSSTLSEIMDSVDELSLVIEAFKENVKSA